MKTKLHPLHVFTFAITSLLFLPLSVKADSYYELAELTDDLEDVTDDLEEEFEDHYEDSRNYENLESYLDRIDSKNSRIHRRSRSRSSLTNGIRQDVADLDSLVHNLHEVVDQMERDAGRFALRKFGNTKKVHSLLASLENIVHRMERHSGALGQGRDSQHRNTRTTEREQSSRYGYSTGKPSNRHSYPSGDYRNDRDHDDHDDHDHDDDDDDDDDHSEGGNLLQKIHRKHMRVRDAIFGRN